MTSTPTALHATHEAAGAQFTDFSGWWMPLRYDSDLTEHHRVRQGVGLFDLSHMAEIMVTGAKAAEFLDYALSATHSTMEPGRAKYSLILAPDGGILDDLIVYRLGHDSFLVVANAGNRHTVFDALSDRSGRFGVDVVDRTDQTVMVALQGPDSQHVLQALGHLDVTQPLDGLGYYRTTTATWSGHDVQIARTGYTGEDGFELYIDKDAGVALWEALMSAGAPWDLAPCGLAARDTLRLEAGMPLYGHELTADIHPVQAGLGRSVDKSKAEFVGKGSEPAPGARVLVGITAQGRRAARADYPVTDVEGNVIGVVTSGALSPSLGYPIHLAYVDEDFSDPGTELMLDVRGTPLPGTITRLPFYTRRKDQSHG
jgi:aminomethyltransferase